MVREVAKALVKIGAGDRRTVEKLTGLLNSTDPEIRESVARALGGIGPQASSAVPALAEMVLKKSRNLRWTSATAIGQIGEGALPALPALRSGLSAGDTSLRDACVKALARVSSSSEEVLQDLKALIRDSSPQVRLWAHAALFRHGKSDRSIHLEKILGAQPEVPVTEFCEALMLVGPEGRPAVTSLIAETLRVHFSGDTDPWAAVRTLNAIGLRADDLLVYVWTLDHQDPEVRQQVCLLLPLLGEQARPAIDALRRCLLDSDWKVRAYAVHALGTIAPGDEAVISDLKGMLLDRSLAVRHAARRFVSVSR